VFVYKIPSSKPPFTGNKPTSTSFLKDERNTIRESFFRPILDHFAYFYCLANRFVLQCHLDLVAGGLSHDANHFDDDSHSQFCSRELICSRILSILFSHSSHAAAVLEA
jgi:hypothetical protein